LIGPEPRRALTGVDEHFCLARVDGGTGERVEVRQRDERQDDRGDESPATAKDIGIGAQVYCVDGCEALRQRDPSQKAFARLPTTS
jgi:hypothetical protein